MKIKIYKTKEFGLLSIAITIALLVTPGCANISQSRQNQDGTIEHIKITSIFSKGALSNFKGNHTTKTTSSGVSFSTGETSAQIEELGVAIGAGIKKGLGVP